MADSFGIIIHSLKSHWCVFLRIQLTYVSICLGTDLVSNMRQAITRGNDGPVRWIGQCSNTEYVAEWQISEDAL